MQALRDAMSQLQARNAAVFGLSADTVESHKQFAEKEKLNFPLLADPEAKVIEAYGALIPGRKMANRYTFIIGPDGNIAGIDKSVNAQFDRGQGTFTSEHGLKLALALTDWKVKLGTAVPYFSLPTYEGKTAGFTAGKKATVIAFLATPEPASAMAVGMLEAVETSARFKDVGILGIAPNADETNEKVKAYITDHDVKFPLARDPGGKITARFGAKVAPTLYVLDAKGKVAYIGAADADKLIDALDAVLEGKTPAVQETKPEGTAIKPPKAKP